jgi:hypothetical protein
VLFLLLGIAFQTAAAAPPDPAAYLDFFRWASHQVDAPIEGHINGGGPIVTKPAASGILRISSSEAAAVLKIAPLCLSDIHSLEVASQSLIFESRLEFTNDGHMSTRTAARLKDMEAQRESIILNRAQQMREALGEDAFRRVEQYIRGHASPPPTK